MIAASPPPSGSVPLVECPGCKKPMSLRVLEPSPIAGMTTGHYRCVLCHAETERQFKIES